MQSDFTKIECTRQSEASERMRVHRVDRDLAGWEEVLTRANIPHGAVKGRRFGKAAVATQATSADHGNRSRLAKTGVIQVTGTEGISTSASAFISCGATNISIFSRDSSQCSNTSLTTVPSSWLPIAAMNASWWSMAS